MPDLVTSIKVHNAIMHLWWQDPVYIKERIAFVIRNPKCSRCGRPTVTPGHSHEDYEHGFQYYLEAVITDKCEPLCAACNLMERKGMKPCSGCVKAHQITNGATKIRYIPQFMELCGDCCDPGEKALRKQEQEQFDAHIKKARKEKNERDRIARRPYQDELNARQRLFYQKVKASR
jgi:hypothetical protein